MEQLPKAGLEFLKNLRENNNREWFNAHKPEFKVLEGQMKRAYEALGLLLGQHDDIQKIKPYRIYRDIRFSKDKTPYKTYFSANFERRKPALRGGYYLHIEPGDNSFIGAGFWNPDKADVERIRKEWAIDTEEIRAILADENFKKHWGSLKGRRLKTYPRGFDKNSPDLDLINFKEWIFQQHFTDAEVLSTDFIAQVNCHFQAIRPFFDYMSSVLTTDLNGVSLLND